MANPTLKQVHVDSTDVTTTLLTWKINRKIKNRITSGMIRFHRSILDTISFDENNAAHTVEIWRGASTATDEKIFKGTVSSFKLNGAYIDCVIEDETIKLVRAEVTKSFDFNIDTEAGEISEIVLTLVNTYSDLTADATSVLSSGTVLIVNKFVCNHADVFERIQTLSGLIDWQFYYNPKTDLVNFEPKGYQSNTKILTVGSNIVSSPSWNIDKSKLVNKYTILGSEELVETEDAQDGTGAKTQFTLTSTPFDMRVEVGGVLQTGGNDATSGSFDYSVDIQNKQVNFESGSIPGAGSGNVVFIYNKPLTRTALNKSQTSIDTYGEHKKTQFATELKDVSDVQDYCKKYIAMYKDPFLSTKLSVIDISDVYPGQTLRVVDSVNNIDRDFLVTEIEMVYPYKPDTVNVGDEELRTNNWGNDASRRIRRIEEELGKNQEVLTQLIDLDHNIQYQRRYMKMQKKVVGGTNLFIFGHSTYGVFGTAQFGDTDLGSSTDEQLHQGNNIYKEYVYDTVFHDSGTSTATFNTSTNKITFTSGQVWVSDQIAIGTTFQHATVNVGTVTGTLKYEITFDNGTTWQGVTVGLKENITVTDGTGVKVRVTENAATTASLDSIKNAGSQFTTPAIQVTMEE